MFVSIFLPQILRIQQIYSHPDKNRRFLILRELLYAKYLNLKITQMSNFLCLLWF